MQGISRTRTNVCNFRFCYYYFHVILPHLISVSRPIFVAMNFTTRVIIMGEKKKCHLKEIKTFEKKTRGTLLKFSLKITVQKFLSTYMNTVFFF